MEALEKEWDERMVGRGDGGSSSTAPELAHKFTHPVRGANMFYVLSVMEGGRVLHILRW